ncbi:hypothetical protein AB0K60_03605 [Thermopolyspora sp. NPDC052614]|uniref:hypothetical protein n=1 Tax=Thermopolyspora sp. NPDC052614 TaxID=3155682 RepID=UPI0034380BA9
MPDEWSDEELLARLADLLAGADAVPPALVDAAKAAYVWHDLIDPDLADGAFPSDSASEISGEEFEHRLATPVWDTGIVELPLDAGLARLTFDSALADREAPLTRTSAASRALTLIATELTIELEISKDVLYGQLIPAEPGEVRMGTVSGEAMTAIIDEIGQFTLRGMPGEPFRLHCRTHSGVTVCTTWICP